MRKLSFAVACCLAWPAFAQFAPQGVLSFISPNLSLFTGTAQPVLLALSLPAPPGLTITATSDNAAVTVQTLGPVAPGSTLYNLLVFAVSGPASVTVTAVAPNYVPARLMVTVSSPSAQPLGISTAALAPGDIFQPYTQNLVATGGVLPYKWFLTNGSLPNGLSLNPLTGAITGIPRAAANSLPLVFRVEDNIGQTLAVALSLTIRAPAISLPETLTLEPGLDDALVISLPGPAPASGVLLTITSSNPAVASPMGSVFIPAGWWLSGRARVAGVSPGTAILTVSADGYAPATTGVQVGGINGRITFQVPPLNLIAPATQTLSFTLSPPAPPEGLRLRFASTNPAAISTPSSLLIPGSAGSGLIQVSTVGLGSASVTASGLGYASASTLINVYAPPVPLGVMPLPPYPPRLANTTGSVPRYRAVRRPINGVSAPSLPGCPSIAKPAPSVAFPKCPRASSDSCGSWTPARPLRRCSCPYR
ncbi:MAG: putative Ig domain-containing protein [Bryobacteraceae bacterium]|nr:putative Ig domain-containing protein [Bryobacteraceae bacterium]